MNLVVRPAAAGAGAARLLATVTVAIAVATVMLAGCAVVSPTEPRRTSPNADVSTPPASSSVPTTPDASELPVAVMVAADGDIVGRLGTFDLDGRGSDSPWLPFDTLPAAPASRDVPLTVRFADATSIGSWSASIAPAGDTTGARIQSTSRHDAGPPVATISVGPLPPGRWVLAVTLARADGRGSGTTYWAMTVQ